MIAIVGFCYRKYTHCTLYGSFPPIYGIAIVRSLLFLFLAHFHESANIFVAIKSGSTVSANDPNSLQSSRVLHYARNACMFQFKTPISSVNQQHNVRAAYCFRPQNVPVTMYLAALYTRLLILV